MPTLTVAALVAVMGMAGGAAPSNEAAHQALAEGERAFVDGERAYDLGHWDEAIRGFETSYRLTGDPILLYDLAQAHRQAGHARLAVTTYRAYLRQRPDASNRSKVEERIAELEAQLRSAAAPAPAAPAPGDISAPVAVVRTAPSGTPVGPTLPAWVPWAGVGLTAALATGAVVSTVSAQSRYDHLRQTCAPCSESEIDDLKARVVVRDVLWVATGLSAALTGIGFYLGQREAAVSVAGRF
jgi:hypothetical protein